MIDSAIALDSQKLFQTEIMLQNSKDKEDNEEESCPLVQGDGNSTQIESLRHPSPQRSNIWIFATFILVFLLLAIGIRDYVQSKRMILQQCGFENGFDTEWSKFLWCLAQQPKKMTTGLIIGYISSSCSRSNRCKKGQILRRNSIR